jgi:hypothetical protein
MCTGLEPMLLAALPGTIASAGGAYINNQIQNDAVQAQNRENQRVMEMQTATTEAERARQDAWAADQQARTMEALMRVDPTARAETIATEVADPKNEIVAGAEAYNIPTLQGQITDSASGRDIGKTVSDALARTTDLLRAQSTLSAGGVQTGKAQDELIRMAGDVGNIGGFRMNSAQVAQREAAVPAATVTPGNSILGDALLLAGQLLAGSMGKSAGMSGQVPASSANIFAMPTYDGSLY